MDSQRKCFYCHNLFRIPVEQREWCCPDNVCGQINPPTTPKINVMQMKTVRRGEWRDNQPKFCEKCIDSQERKIQEISHIETRLEDEDLDNETKERIREIEERNKICGLCQFRINKFISHQDRKLFRGNPKNIPKVIGRSSWKWCSIQKHIVPILLLVLFYLLICNISFGGIEMEAIQQLKILVPYSKILLPLLFSFVSVAIFGHNSCTTISISIIPSVLLAPLEVCLLYLKIKQDTIDMITTAMIIAQGVFLLSSSRGDAKFQDNSEDEELVIPLGVSQNSKKKQQNENLFRWKEFEVSTGKENDIFSLENRLNSFSFDE